LEITPEEEKKPDNRIGPCKPALEKEIPEDGRCPPVGYFGTTQKFCQRQNRLTGLNRYNKVRRE